MLKNGVEQVNGKFIPGFENSSIDLLSSNKVGNEDKK